MTTFYEIARFCNLPNLSDSLFCYIERLFTVVSETENFLQQSFAAIAKILSSSSLHVTSELEVFHAVNFWLNHNNEIRRVFARDLLLKVRLRLIPKSSLRYLLRKNCFLTKDDECVEMIENVLKEKREYHRSDIANYHRYCDQDMFNILVCGGCSDGFYLKSIHQVDVRNPSKTNALQMPKSRAYFKAVYLKGEIYFFYGSDKVESLTSVDKYSMFNKTWECVSDDGANQQRFTACGLMDKIYVCGGHRRNNRAHILYRNTDRMLDTEDRAWKNIAKMRHKRRDAACSVYRGQVVVTGGCYQNEPMRNVESYDHALDEWVEMPSMINAQYRHSQVTVKNKLFIISCDRSICEVFDSHCQQFVLINKPKTFYADYNSPFGAFSVGKKIVAYDSWRHTFSCYDIEKDKWSEEEFELTKNLGAFACVKIPHSNVF